MSNQIPQDVREVLEKIQDLAASDCNHSENVDEIFHLTDGVLTKYAEAETAS
ncbi:hypothetical protein JWG45_03740 [Leptospira sp. 201903070]|uniref:Uncharacterized protein n=1 Tax=Leptospira ainlahdjerensis TaxID=2810033 RepID=A0ABS2U904_9LEPT|nr:hypothetical protein [Leptospira ainlahdjerensis]MBM9576259.1 hypothetical protein [Leptospira ainlahdjerensis]